jgi:predicted nuclease with TOPRIM domain
MQSNILKLLIILFLVIGIAACSEADGPDLKAQIEKTKKNIVSLKQDRDKKVLPLEMNYMQMHDQYYPYLTQKLPEIGIRNHEELLKNCEQYLELCSLLNRVAKLQYYISKLDDKLKQIGANIIKLDDNVWNMERTLELAQIFSDEELESVEQLIEETKGKIDSQVPPPEKQDIAGLEEQIFDNILRS